MLGKRLDTRCGVDRTGDSIAQPPNHIRRAFCHSTDPLRKETDSIGGAARGVAEHGNVARAVGNRVRAAVNLILGGLHPRTHGAFDTLDAMRGSVCSAVGSAESTGQPRDDTVKRMAERAFMVARLLTTLRGAIRLAVRFHRCGVIDSSSEK